MEAKVKTAFDGFAGELKVSAREMRKDAREMRNVAGQVLPSRWHDEGDAEAAHRRSLPLQGGRQASPGCQCVQLLAQGIAQLT